MNEDTNSSDEVQYQNISDLVGEGYIPASVEPIEPPRARYTVGGFSIVLGDQYGEGTLRTDGWSEGSVTVRRYDVDGYVVSVESDANPAEDSPRIKVD